ncbi:PEP-CTERM sorting domain-containing protein [Verrucomicrobiaceae bacterium 227]
MKHIKGLKSRPGRVRSLLTGFIVAVSAVSSPAALSVGWNYQGVGGVGLVATDSAGAPGFEQANWNNHAGAGQGPGATPFENLVESTGAATGMDVVNWTQASANSWQHSETANADQILMNDFADTDVAISFSSIPFETYDIVVYYGNNEGPSSGVISVAGIDRSYTTGNSASSSFGSVGYLEGTDLNSNDPSNYTVFRNVSGESQSIAFTGGANNGVSAIQFVDAVPEPSSTGLLLLGSLAIVLRRKRHC